MTMLECSCKDAYKQSVRSKTFVEREDDDESRVLEKKQDVWGNCSCLVKGKKLDFDGISLEIESKNEDFIRGESVESELGSYRATAPSVALAAPARSL